MSGSQYGSGLRVIHISSLPIPWRLLQNSPIQSPRRFPPVAGRGPEMLAIPPRRTGVYLRTSPVTTKTYKTANRHPGASLGPGEIRQDLDSGFRRNDVLLRFSAASNQNHWENLLG
jgi:hypothetical protein